MQARTVVGRAEAHLAFCSRHARGAAAPRTPRSSASPHRASQDAPLPRRSLMAGLLAGVAATGAPRSIASAANFTSAEQVLQDPQWPEAFPFKADSFDRYDESPDSIFYSSPRFVTHIDDAAIAALTEWYDKSFPAPGPDLALLDICSSWITHYPKRYYKVGRVAGLGMNAEELARNEALTEYAVQDLNKDPSLPYEDAAFDVITCAVSVDYLNRPMEVFKEMARCLKPGGMAVMSFSNRCFPTKAISLWTQTGDLDHVWIVGSYFHYAGEGLFDAPAGKEITKRNLLGMKGDPMYVVYGRKKA